MAKSDKLPVNTRSVIRRLDRLLPEHQILKRRQDSFFVIDTKLGSIVEEGELDAVARKMGALQAWERIDSG